MSDKDCPSFGFKFRDLMREICKLVTGQNVLQGSCYKAALLAFNETNIADRVILFSFPNKPECIAHAIAVDKKGNVIETHDKWAKLGGKYKKSHYLYTGKKYPVYKELTEQDIKRYCNLSK